MWKHEVYCYVGCLVLVPFLFPRDSARRVRGITNKSRMVGLFIMKSEPGHPLNQIYL